MNNQDRRWELAAKLLTNTLAPEEQEEWVAALTDPEFRTQFEQLQKDWHTLGTLPYDRISTQLDWQKVQQAIHARHQPARRVWLAPVWRYAATILLGVAVAFYAGRYTGTGADEGQLTTIEAPPGSRTAITLPDSSRVWLNAHSRLSYQPGFGTTHRRLTLEGEAFFDVNHAEEPFTIQAPQYTITVLGTAFNVNAYPDEAVSTTTLVRGSLQVTRINAQGTEETIVLKPNEKAVFRQPGLVVEKNVDAASEMSWKEGWLTVRGESLHELAKKIERLYDVKVNFEDKSLQDYRYSGRIRQFSLEQVLKALALTSPVAFTIQEKNVTLRENKDTRHKYESLKNAGSKP